MYYFKAIFLMCFGFMLLACVEHSKTDKDNPRPEKLSAVSLPVDKGWIIELQISGGFAGTMQNISVDSGGILIISDLKLNKTVRKKLNNKELDKLSGLIGPLKNLQTRQTVTNLGGFCADCFQYKVSIRWQNSQALVSLNDINLEQSLYKNTVLFLREISAKYPIE